jgi:hypothetical protein
MANQLESFTRRQFLAGAAAIVGLFLLGGCGPSELDRQVEAYKSEKTELPSLIGLDRLQRLIDTGEGMSEIVAENRISINEFIDLAAAINQENLIGLESGQLNNLMLRNANIISGLAALTINKLKTETPAGSMITDLPVKLELPGEIQDSYQEKVLAAQKLVEKINLPDMTNIPQEAWSTDFLKLFKALASHSLLQTMILERLTRADEDIVTQNDALNSARHTFLFGAIYDYLSLRPYDDGAARLDDWGAQVMDKSYWLLHKIDPESSGINPDVYDQEVLYSAYIGQLDSLANLTDETWQEQWQQFLNGLLDLRFNYLIPAVRRLNC